MFLHNPSVQAWRKVRRSRRQERGRLLGYLAAQVTDPLQMSKLRLFPGGHAALKFVVIREIRVCPSPCLKRVSV